MLFLPIITYCYLVATAFLNLIPKSILKMFLGVELKAKTNNGSFDDSRGLGSDTLTVRFSSPISINEIVFAARENLSQNALS